MHDELRECPFCGDEAEPFKQEEHDYFSLAAEKSFFLFGVGCWDCGCQIYGYDTEQEAIDAWNQRAERTCKNKRNDINKGKAADHPNNWFAFLCSKCGMGQRLQYKNDYCPNCGAKVISGDENDVLTSVKEVE